MRPEKEKKEPARYTVNDLCVMTGITRKTLFYYDKTGLLEPVSREGAQQNKMYGDREYERLLQILAYKEAGLLLREIREVLDQPDGEKLPVLAKAKKRLEREHAEKEKQLMKLNELIRCIS